MIESTKPDVAKLTDIVAGIRRNIMRMACKAGGSHIASSFSIVEILTVLYFGNVLHYDPQNPRKPDRDRLILSKGHAGAAIYAALAKAGFFAEELLDTYCQSGTILGGHPKMDEVPGVEASTGALGHGFPYGVGVALAGKMDKLDYRVFVILGDGECQEGSIWEAALFASQQKLGHLVAIVDHNKLQAMDCLDNIVSLEPFADKWRAFGWNVRDVDGHNIQDLIATLPAPQKMDAPPLLVIAHTVKGKGVSFMENVPIWHYRLPDKHEMEIVCRELNMEI